MDCRSLVLPKMWFSSNRSSKNSRRLASQFGPVTATIYLIWCEHSRRFRSRPENRAWFWRKPAKGKESASWTTLPSGTTEFRATMNLPGQWENWRQRKLQSYNGSRTSKSRDIRIHPSRAGSARLRFAGGDQRFARFGKTGFVRQSGAGTNGGGGVWGTKPSWGPPRGGPSREKGFPNFPRPAP